MLNQVASLMIHDGQEVLDEIEISFVSPPIYEVIRVINGTPLFLHEHFERMMLSAKLSGISINFSESDLLVCIASLVNKTGIKNNNVRLEVGKTENNQVTWVLFWVHSYYPEEDIYNQGVNTITYKAIRDNPHAKVFRSDFAKTILELRKKHDAYEILLVKQDDIITEGSRSNLFFIKNNVVYSAKESDVLQGITRLKLIDLMSLLNIEWIETDIKVDELKTFDACFISGTSIHLLPVAKINHICYTSAKHPLLLRLETEFNKIVRDNLENTMRRVL